MDFSLARIGWDAAAAGHLAPAMRGDPCADVDWLAGQVREGAALLIGVSVDGTRTGSVVLRGEEFKGVRELVIVAAGGTWPGPGRGAEKVLPELLRLADEWGADWVRVHTARPGLAHELERAGFTEAERVFRKAVG